MSFYINLWRKMPYWLKGAVIFLTIMILLVVIMPYLYSHIFCNLKDINPQLIQKSGSLCQKFIDHYMDLISRISFNWLDFLSLIFCNGVCVGEEGMIHLITTIPSWLIIGAVIGFVYGLIKKHGGRNEV